MQDNLEHKLAAKEKELETLKAEFQEFAYIVSHDLKAPFRQIEGFVQIIHENHAGSFDERTNKHFDLILAGTENCKNILDSLLAFSRLGQQNVEMETIDCVDIFERAKARNSETIARKNASVSSEKLPSLHADAQQMTVLFSILLSNALLYQTEGNNPKVHMDALRKDNHWVLSISDNGIGIADNVKDKIFKPLRRGVGREYPGMGMGLAFAKKIVERHGGDIWTSPSDEGAIIQFSILDRTPK